MARRIVVVALLAALVGVPAARADGDPASDYLLSQPAFVPPDAGVPKAYSDQLLAAIREAKARGFTIRVALIGSLYDMGSVTALYKKPKLYARFLGQELSFVYKNRLLVVMRNGLAVSRNGKPIPSEQRVVDRIPSPQLGGAALASAGTTAVVRLAAASGVVVPQPPLAASGSGKAGSTWRDRIVIIVAAAVLLALGVLVVRLRGGLR